MQKNPAVLESAYLFFRVFSPLCSATAVREPLQEKIIQLIFRQRRERSVSKDARGGAPRRSNAAESLTWPLSKGNCALRPLLLGWGRSSQCQRTGLVDGRAGEPIARVNGWGTGGQRHNEVIPTKTELGAHEPQSKARPPGHDVSYVARPRWPQLVSELTPGQVLAQSEFFDEAIYFFLLKRAVTDAESSCGIGSINLVQHTF